MPKKITIRGVIGWSDEATPKYLETALKDANGEDIELEFSSPGGLVMQGLEMANMVRNYKGKTTARIVGLAASMSSYIPMMADEVIVEDNAIYMIHNVFGGMWGGDYREAEKLAKNLRALRDLLAKAYVTKTGKKMEDVQKMMDDETYLYGEEIVSEGFADSVIAAESDTDKETAMALATAQIKDCEAQLKAKEEESRADFEQLAAYLKTEPVAQKKVTPAESGKKPQGEVKQMTLEQLLADNPAAKAEFDAKIASAKSEGESTGKEMATAAWKAAAPILASAEYPQSVKDRVLAKAEKCDVEGLQDFVATHDMIVAAKTVDGAAVEQGAETPAQAPEKIVKPNEEGLIDNDGAAAVVAKLKGGAE